MSTDKKTNLEQDQNITTIKEGKNNGQEEKNLHIGDVISKTELFIDKNKKKLSIGVGIILIVIIGICLFKFWYMPKQERLAENDMFAAQYYYNTDDYQKALNGDGKHPGFISISQEYSHTQHGKLASYYAGSILLTQGKYSQAIEYLKNYSSDDEYLYGQVLALIGDCYWELGSLDEAINYYTKASKHKPNLYTTPAQLLKLGSVYMAKKDNQKALEAFQTIKKEYPRSPEFAQAEEYIAYLETLINK